MNRSGEYVTNFTSDIAYKSFKPSPLPPHPELSINDDITNKLVEANNDLKRLNAIFKSASYVNSIVPMFAIKEALISSQIEGIYCTLDDVLNPNIDRNKNLDVEDVINYVKACDYAIDRLEKLPLCNRLLKEIHKKLLNGVRGQEKNPGEFRHSQNWIGAVNSTLKEARHIPPNVRDMNIALDELEKYINEDDGYDPLIKIGLIHYQFETIHPFLDGNGRVGRLLILLYLMEHGYISKPIIYVSYFLKKNQLEYYDRMSEVRRSGNYEQWVGFFLEAISAAAKDSLTTVEELSALHENNIKRLPIDKRKSGNTRRLFGYIERYPIIDVKKTAIDLKLSYNATSNAIKKLVQLGILKETTNNARNRIFSYEDYLNILRKDT